MTTIHELNQEMKKDGYVSGSPSSGLAVDIDSNICYQSECPNCKHQGMEYHPFVTNNSYRAFARCPSCGHMEEF